MKFISFSRLLLVMATLAGTLVLPSKAQDGAQDYVAAHNQARGAVGVGPIQWDDTIAAYAQSYAQRLSGNCNLIHSDGKYGENLAMGSRDLSGISAVNMWVNEKANYNYLSNTCINGECRHYTQVVWRKSVRLGCGKARCNNGGTIISCNYDPRGNYLSEKPY